jgi:photosystem II stability/assembly factor-like uncharacterized protein
VICGSLRELREGISRRLSRAAHLCSISWSVSKRHFMPASTATVGRGNAFLKKSIAALLCVVGQLTCVKAAQICNAKGPFILYGVNFPDARHGWAVGDGGLILATTDGGSNWCVQNSGATDDLMSVKFADNQRGWAVAFEHGTVLSSRDSGATWQRQTIHGQEGLDSISFIDPLHGWIVGMNGAIFATSDGGVNWHAQSINSRIFGRSWLMSVQFVDAQHGWAVGKAIVATRDGGATWVDTQANNLDSNNRALLFFRSLHSVYFVDSQHGWIAADGKTILVTTDGGTTWRPQLNSDYGNNLNSIYFVDQKRGWAVGNSGMILATTDGGATWVVQNSRTGPPYDIYVGLTANLNSIFCSDRQHCWAAGSAETILSTADGGKTWRVQH